MTAPSSAALAVIVPFYNEAEGIGATLAALAAQTDRNFRLILVDNGSTDETTSVIRAFSAEHPSMDVEVITELQKGTGAAADTGMRHAISGGARLLARTDADCLPRADWVAEVRQGFADGLLFIAGVIVARTDEFALRPWERWLLPGIVAAAATFGRLRADNRGPQFRCHYVMCAGNNLALTADLYRQCGGFPRSAIENLHEDRALVNRARRYTDRIGRRRDMVVANSIRRLRAYGLRTTLLWYWDHRARPEVIDVR